MVDSYELRKGSRVLRVVDDDLSLEVEAAVAKERMEHQTSGDHLGCDC